MRGLNRIRRGIIDEFGQSSIRTLAGYACANPWARPVKYKTRQNVVGESRVDEFKRHLTRSLAERVRPSRVMRRFNFMTLSACREISLKTRVVIVELFSINPALTRPWPSSALAPALPGKAQPSRPPIPHISSFRNRISKATARRVPTTVKCWPSSRERPGRAGAQSRVTKAKSFWITLRSMPNRADRSAIADGFTRMITTLWSLR